MTSMSLMRSELRKLTTTRMPLAFGAVLVVLAAVNGVAVAIGTDMDGSKSFISTGADQQSLIAFAANAMVIAGLFGAIASAREYAYKTAIATFLITPHRGKALRAQLAAVGAAGAVLGLAGATFTTLAVVVALPMTDFGFMVTAGGLAQVLAASAWAGAVGAVLGSGIATLVRNTGGAVSGAVLVLVIAPPVVIQLASGAAPWVPSSLANVISGVASDTSTTAAGLAIAMWALIPAIVASWSVKHRDVA
jgi:hypothetical protein